MRIISVGISLGVSIIISVSIVVWACSTDLEKHNKVTYSTNFEKHNEEIIRNFNIISGPEYISGSAFYIIEYKDTHQKYIYTKSNTACILLTEIKEKNNDVK